MELRYIAILIGAVLAATAAGCKKRQDVQPPAPVAPAPPAAGGAPTPAPAPDPRPSTGFQPVGRPNVVNKENRWALPKYDAGAKPDAPAARPATKTLAYSTDADIAKFKEEKARAETERAVNSTLGAALPRLKACLDQHGAASGELMVSVRVHRTGHVMSSSATGVSGPASTCINGVLNQLQVQGVQTDSVTVQRSFKFDSQR